ncbi:hypothetical protein M1146_07270 [Patescibacteria group bacterium]|nr:hypothetical protein [Patescibacteria group bacterium]
MIQFSLLAGQSSRFKYWSRSLEYQLRLVSVIGDETLVEVQTFGEICSEYSEFSDGMDCLVGKQLEPDIDINFHFTEGEKEKIFFFNVPPFAGRLTFGSIKPIPGYVISEEMKSY